jgi:hypothetical protein
MLLPARIRNSGFLNISKFNTFVPKQVSDGYLLLVHGNFKILQ